ncbi:preprotein translocase subunit SecY [Mucilaginibacter sp. AW1-7]|jgi:preprotein translocase subunit SecY|uniref:preprotein translocase subunit SecY n=1 Tax=unclassified Mucilaginibacter TaxID=2617802 RepID=UPI0008C45BAF|nr:MULTISPECIES: preprotein translocase subunit SecY [unclassified Mucilaginibacter]WDF79255.1 preprotein translocase subunit SecY [Mucilaginibacter sp. KACC 22773]SEO48995.1 protein translocase subunit secY/sec61 alpha [Mucilaginibacter sp. OK283]
MKKFFTTLSNIWKIEDLRVRIINTLLFLAIYRVGTFVVLPGVNPALVANQKAEGLVGLLNMFAGGAFSHSSIFALGVMPYISASIVVQLLGIAVPYFTKLQKEGESGRNKLNQWTRYLTIGITALQAIGYLKSQISADAMMISNPFFTVLNMFVLTAGTLFVMWLGEKITDKGIGNGISLIIMVGIIAQLPGAFLTEFNSRTSGTGGLITFIVEIVGLIGVVMFTILIVQGTRKIAVQYAKRIVGNKQYGGVRQYIPLKVNAAGVMPIIFAQALMFIPQTVQQFMPSISSNGILIALSNYNSWQHNTLFGVLIILFTYFYTAITVNPNQMADDMKKNGGFIPGVKPGKSTADYIDGVISKITLPGSIFLAMIAIIPAIASLVGVSPIFARFFGGTSLIILVGVVLDTLQQIESHLLMRHYDGLMKTGRIKGRTAMPAAAGTSPTAI